LKEYGLDPTYIAERMAPIFEKHGFDPVIEGEQAQIEAEVKG